VPSAAQRLIEAAGTQPDFLYEEQRVAIYVDGPFHDYPHRREGDRMKDDELLNEGIVSIRFAHDDEEGWRATIAKNDWLFGEGR
jgi:very-short-patch-repair endonuclease